jgi:pimeloyl-ACP methyl ester carboxylesterase
VAIGIEVRTLRSLFLFVLCYCSAWTSHAEEGSRYIRKLDPTTPVIVFVHGVLGNSTETWTNADKYWPKMLTEDPAFNETSIYVLEYDSQLLRGGLSINELALNMRLKLSNHNVLDHREIIFLTHSMGGLITRSFLLNRPDIAAKTRFIYFFSTPTTGANIAKWAALVARRNPQFRNMKPLQSDSFLSVLQNNWLEAQYNNIPSYCAYETEPTSPYWDLIVDQASAKSLCNRPADPIQADHVNIVKPANTEDTPYIAFRNAFKKTGPITGPVLADNCKPGLTLAKIGNDQLPLTTGLCSDKIRIRYLWLNAGSVSLLLSGKIVGDFAKAVGERPFVLQNKVTDELSFIVKNFGFYLSPNRDHHAQTSVENPDEKYASSKKPLNSFLREVGRLHALSVHDEIPFPDVDAYLHMKTKKDFPANYLMCYLSPSLDGTLLWRYLSKADLDSYESNTARLRDLILSRKINFDSNNFSLRTLQKQKANLRHPQAPLSIMALRYFTRAGLPDDFLVARAVANPIKMDEGCVTRRGLDFAVSSPDIYVLVAVIENSSENESLPISVIKGMQIDTDRLRPRESDGNWTPIEFEFRVGEIKKNETIVVPLEIEFRDDAFPRDMPTDDQTQLFQAIKADSHGEFIGRNWDGTVVQKKAKEAFKSPEWPTPIKYTYGPRIKLTAALSRDAYVRLREFDPNNTYMYFGQVGGSCPTVYVHVDGDSPKAYGHVLIGAGGKAQSKLDEIVLDGPAESIEIVEEEPEITTIKRLKVFVSNLSGRERLALELRDQQVLPGVPLRIAFPELRTTSGLRIEVEGYYEPLRNLLFSGRANDSSHVRHESALSSIP